MNDNQSLLTVFIGFLCIFLIGFMIKTIRQYYIFKASFYTEIYSGFFEYMVKHGNLRRMSKSYWLENELGEHRLMFQITKSQTDDIIQPYILILLSSGLYVIQTYNESAHYVCNKQKMKKITENENHEKIVQNLPFPISQFESFQNHFQDLIGEKDIPMKYMMLFTDLSQLDLSSQTIPFVQKHQFISTLKLQHTTSKCIFEQGDIERIYHLFQQKVLSL
ncbi:hypothetical protein [Candidatus Stoquefichus sp. SB1]|uniref:hypothetical protein n=1 Tax=Candidatus Stoquefichus sp. SB1 TaxID=1658109 RepID=UPI00067EED7F|nr:hypothetical protein [Candidatus Stoquefichus sp. SB1]